ncbi:putative N-acetyltransferase YhbS [Salirhabdus euzebyi]|uniref:Putative N-acetyltransferase YhbS n=1 Tax=Salirhabdus euzebyi TaxID=394506 RepID=A0A841Q4G3_9BACI|nr:GNAT family N-acetyltransferase [Salirhabdus euzebyi]MBB6453253.1 putative N-acetyltransferase YhbS [Salirhabdus euzebyi]
MDQLTFRKGYQHDKTYRTSFNKLAKQIFGIHFETWYEHGFWTDQYEPYSYSYDKEIIANVSVNKLDLMVNKNLYSAIQIGTVMTHPDHRNKGLSRKLMDKVLADYEEQADIMYLFANDSVLEFYPKFGFHREEEYQYTHKVNKISTTKTLLHKLDGKNKKDLTFIYQYAQKRILITDKFSSSNAANLFMFYCLNVFPNDIYYVKSLDVIVIFQQQQDTVHLFDILSTRPFSIKEVLVSILNPIVTEVVFHFSVDDKELNVEKINYHSSEVLFCKTKPEISWPKYEKHPLTSQA